MSCCWVVLMARWLLKCMPVTRICHCSGDSEMHWALHPGQWCCSLSSMSWWQNLTQLLCIKPGKISFSPARGLCSQHGRGLAHPSAGLCRHQRGARQSRGPSSAAVPIWHRLSPAGTSWGPWREVMGERCCLAPALPQPAVSDTGFLALA